MTPLELQRPDGKTCPGYLAEPAQGGSRAGIVVIHEMWGITEPVRAVTQRCAAAGYRAVIPDLFRGKLADSLEQGFQMMRELDWLEAATQDVRGAVQWLGREGGRCAVIGFCLGGALAILAALHVPELNAAVCFYGVPPPEAGDPAAIRIPLLGHFARRDDWCTPQKVDALEQRLREGHVDFELHRYDAAHAFMNPGGAGYSEKASAVAWERTLGFLGRKLGGPPGAPTIG